MDADYYNEKPDTDRNKNSAFPSAHDSIILRYTFLRPDRKCSFIKHKVFVEPHSVWNSHPGDPIPIPTVNP